MTLSAASSSPALPLSAVAVLAALAALAGYALLCAASPFGPCRKCHGMGFKTKTNQRGQLTRGRACRRCKGNGRRLRIGRRFFHTTQATSATVRRLHKTGSR